MPQPLRYLKSLPYLLMWALLNSCIELEISAPGFPDMAVELKATEVQIGLTITYNLMGFCLASIAWGPLSEAYGRRRIMLIGNAILALGATGCVFASCIGWLWIARFVQGLGAATSAVLVSAIIADVYPAKQASRLYGLMNAIFAVVIALSPILGGIITTYVGWRGNYGVVAGVAISALGLLYCCLPETKKNFRKLNPSTFIRDYIRLFRSGKFLNLAIIPSVCYGCYLAFIAVAPFFYQERYHLGMKGYLIHQAIVISSFALVSAIIEKIRKYFGNSKALFYAICLIMLGSLMMILASNPIGLTSAMILFNIGFAIMFPIIVPRSLEIFPEMKGTASSAITGLRYLLCTFITGLSSELYHINSRGLGIVFCSVSLTVAVLYFKSVKHMIGENHAI